MDGEKFSRRISVPDRPENPPFLIEYYSDTGKNAIDFWVIL